MRLLIVANWKMNPQKLAEAKQLFVSVKNKVRDIKGVEAVICPPFIYLATLAASAFTCKKTGSGGLALGSQNCFWEEKGAFNGEISPLMLKNLGCKYVIIGHSERRRYFSETDEMINKKIKAAIIVKLKPIFCFGETGKERKTGKTFKVLKSQIKNGLEGISKDNLKKIILAYEPVWAIGTGKSCGISEARAVNLFIRKAFNLPVLYGGSVNSKNAVGYIREAQFQGLLAGGASLNPKEFIKIIKNISKS